LEDSGSAAAPRSRYAEQLALLSETYQQVHEANLISLAQALSATSRRQATYVGSGGALGVARLAAELHENRTHKLARAATPLELVRMAPLAEHAVVLFSAGARHPDSSLAALSALRRGANPVILVTHRKVSELPKGFPAEVEVITLPGLSGREGFLATNSVLAMCAALIAASGFTLSKRLPGLRSANGDALREETIILTAPGLGAPATDLETRLSETGLSTAQVTDYRNFAHGRHTGLARRIDQTSVVALVDPSISELAERTLRLLPAEAHQVRLQSRLSWPLSTLDLLVASMNLIATTAAATDLDPGRPSVPRFGRRLYHLSSRKLLAPAGGPVDHKLSALGVGGPQRLRRRYEKAAAEWVDGIRRERFLGFVFDYDGTVCSTDARFDLPRPEIQIEFLRLLEEGALLGFASGRGGSLYRDLRAWIPRAAWQQVELGLYNGGLQLALDEVLRERVRPTDPIREAAKRFRAGPLASYAELSERQHQLAISPDPQSGLALDSLAQIAQEVISVPPALALKVVVSGHSIDVIPADSAKTNTLERVERRVGGGVVAFGDQGQVGGNDFELLAATRWSLSVDRVSADPNRCWNLDDRGQRGPELLLRYLRSFHRLKDGFVFRKLRK
jgi:hydroxymethylpyrimidine pyrophosphatase-like HAD family hydrolase